MRTVEQLRELVRQRGYRSATIARYTSPSLSPSTVWRIVKGRSGGTAAVVEVIDRAVDRLEAERRDATAAGVNGGGNGGGEHGGKVLAGEMRAGEQIAGGNAP